MCFHYLYNFWFCRFIVILLENHILILLVLCLMVSLEVLLYIRSMIHDSSIVVTFGGPPFDILIRVLSFNYNVIVGFVDREKIANQVPSAIGVGSMDWKKNVVKVVDFGINEFGFMRDSKDSFWNTMFEK